MKAIKSLLAVSVLVAAGAANAATVATFGITDVANSMLYKAMGMDILSSGSGSGTGTLDDSGVLSMTVTNHLVTMFGTDSTLNLSITVNGAWDGSTFTASSGSQFMTGCSDAAATLTCPGTYPTPSEVLGASGSFTLAGGNLTLVHDTPNATTTYTYTLSAGTPAVPVPAAAWLFGSGLLGLAGTARRRAA